MKSMVITLVILMSGVMASAVPIMDTATGTTSALLVTVIPDSINKNLYYFFPTDWTIAVTNANKPVFSYIEYSTGFFSSEAYVTSAFAAESSPELQAKVKEILKDNPAAKFTPIPLMSAKYVPHKNFNKFIKNVDCLEMGNTVGQRIGCTWTVAVDSSRVFYRVVKANGMVQVLEYDYTFGAMVNGKFTTIEHSAAVYLGGLEHGDFWDSNGRRL